MTLAVLPRPDVVALVLGGGRGTRLFPLTKMRSKPAVPLAGKYRLIDIALSNCINSGIRKIHVLTQFNSASLNRHINETYKFDWFSGGFVEILAAEQTPEIEQWFQGTADAVRRNLHHLIDHKVTHILVLPGDALYRMDFGELVAQHQAAGADVSICCKPVAAAAATAFGIVGIDAWRRIGSFHEKPSADRLAGLEADPAVLAAEGFDAVAEPYLASMGIYLFNRDALVEVLADSSQADFSKEVIPAALSTHRVVAYPFAGYWEDIGTIPGFFHANLQLLDDHKGFDFYDFARPIFTRPRVLPGSEVYDSRLDRVIVSEGSLVRHASIRRSLLGIRSVVRAGADLENVVMMGADYFEQAAPEVGGVPGLGIGEGTVVKNAIIDKNARIGSKCRIVNERGVRDESGEWYQIRDGIVVVLKNAIVPDNTSI